MRDRAFLTFQCTGSFTVGVMTTTTPPPDGAAKGRQLDDESVTPYRIDVPDAALTDLHDRLARTRWPDEPPDVGWEYGVPRANLEDLVDHWRTEYDWRTHEARLNKFEQYTTNIDGERLHFMHVRSPERDALPLLVTYGWPSSIVDFWQVIGPLTQPRAHGGDPADAFDVIVPSLPGFGFSGPTRETGWNLDRHTRALSVLMNRLGYDSYAAHGGDFGTLLAPALGRLEPERVVGVHLNGLLSLPPRDPAVLEALNETDRVRLEHTTKWRKKRRGYALIQATRPQTLAYGLTDSPAGLLAWLADAYEEFCDPQHRPERDHMLTNITTYWLTGTAGSSARLFKETARDIVPAGEPSTVPTGVATFPHEPALPIRSLAEHTHNIVHWSEFNRGGHFPAMEVPDLLIEDLCTFFRRFR